MRSGPGDTLTLSYGLDRDSLDGGRSRSAAREPRRLRRRRVGGATVGYLLGRARETRESWRDWLGVIGGAAGARL